MGSSLTNSSYCCCSNNIIGNFFSIENKNLNKCDIILTHQNDINGLITYHKIKILKEVEKKEGLEKFINILNYILDNINNGKFLSKNNSTFLKNNLEEILTEFLKEDEKFLYLKYFNEIVNNKYDFKAIFFS